MLIRNQFFDIWTAFTRSHFAKHEFMNYHTFMKQFRICKDSGCDRICHSFLYNFIFVSCMRLGRKTKWKITIIKAHERRYCLKKKLYECDRSIK